MIHGIHSTPGASTGNEPVQVSMQRETPNFIMKNGQIESQVKGGNHSQSNIKGSADLDRDRGNYLNILVDDNLRQEPFKLPGDLESARAKKQMQMGDQGQKMGGHWFDQDKGNNLNVLA